MGMKQQQQLQQYQLQQQQWQQEHPQPPSQFGVILQLDQQPWFLIRKVQKIILCRCVITLLCCLTLKMAGQNWSIVFQRTNVFSLNIKVHFQRIEFTCYRSDQVTIITVKVVGWLMREHQHGNNINSSGKTAPPPTGNYLLSFQDSEDVCCLLSIV